ncbi:hypothetical protein RHMOL_RhmolUnG0007700 [Rhododendron molle]|nr:hypothetical protein RHMOL_RhmolUnG0007700 [Rhododendron molle]
MFDARGRPREEPFPVRPPAGTRRPARVRLGDPQTASGLGPGPRADPRANPFRDSRIHLPTSLAYIVPSTRGCSPWRDAVMSTTGRERHSVLRIFKGAGCRTPRGVRCSSNVDPTSGEPFRVGGLLSRKITLRGPAASRTPNVAVGRHVGWNFNPIPFRSSR